MTPRHAQQPQFTRPGSQRARRLPGCGWVIAARPSIPFPRVNSDNRHHLDPFAPGVQPGGMNPPDAAPPGAPSHSTQPHGAQVPKRNQSASPSVFRSLGEFFGHIARAIRTDPVAGERIATRTQVEDRTLESARVDVTLRRTVKDEVFVRPAAKISPSPAPMPPATPAPPAASPPGTDHSGPGAASR